MIPSDEALFDLATRVGARLVAAGARLATVESCTGGWIAKALTDVAGSSAWLEAGIVTYGNAAKERLVGVRAQTLARDGAVSEAAVREMATGALASLDVERVVAVSGIAGPAGGSADKPVGTVWLAWTRRGAVGVGGVGTGTGIGGVGSGGAFASVRTRRLRLDGDREAIRRQAVAAALEGLLVDD